MEDKRKPAILVVEDSPEDFFALRRCLTQAGVASELIRCETGEQALDYLLGRDGTHAAHRPDLILLDLNLPGLSGGEVLETIKGDMSLRNIPVVVHSNSGDFNDINESYALGANSYLRKSLREADLITNMRRLKEYWFDAVTLPA